MPRRSPGTPRVRHSTAFSPPSAAAGPRGSRWRYVPPQPWAPKRQRWKRCAWHTSTTSRNSLRSAVGNGFPIPAKSRQNALPPDPADEASGGHGCGGPEVREGELLTPRLRLRPVSAGDLDAIADLNSDPEVMRTITHRPSTRAESAAWL